MFECAVCGYKKSRTDLVNEVFKVESEYVLVEGIPAEVCGRCGEQSFSLATAENVRRAVEGGIPSLRSVEMRVVTFQPEEPANAASP